MGIAYNTNIVRDGLVLYLDAANIKSYPGTGTVWNDLSGNGNNGTLVNGVVYNSSNQGIMVFDGVDDWVSTTFAPNLDNLRLYTYELWFRDATSETTLNTALISNYGPISTTPYSLLHINPDGTLRFGERNTLNQAGTVGSPLSSLVDGVWKHIVGVATSTQLILYVNGSTMGTTAARPGGVITSGQNFVLGSNSLGRFRSCDISMFRIYLDKALSATEVLQNFNAMRGRYNV